MDVRKRAELLAAALDGPDLAPEHAAGAGLTPLLDTARQVRQMHHPVPSPAALASGLVRVREGLAGRRAVRTHSWMGRPAWAVLGLSLVLLLVVLLGGAGTVVAAEGSLPGQVLYPVKRSVEAVQVALTWDPQARSTLLIAVADRRLAEVQAVCAAECPGWLLADLAEQSQAAQQAVEGIPDGRRAELLEKMVLLTERQQEVLERVLERAPEAAKAGLQRALERSRQGQERARQALEKERDKGKDGKREKAPFPPEHPLKPSKEPHGPAQGTPGKGAKKP